MTVRKSIQLVLSLSLIVAIGGRALADDANCVIISAGAQMENTPGALYNVGQVTVGTMTDGVVVMHVGGIQCLAQGIVQCLKGDVDGNGLINGNDIDNYVQVTLTGIGTPKELCAADITIPDFATLLLAGA